MRKSLQNMQWSYLSLSEKASEEIGFLHIYGKLYVVIKMNVVFGYIEIYFCICYTFLGG